MKSCVRVPGATKNKKIRVTHKIADAPKKASVRPPTPGSDDDRLLIYISYI